MKTRVYYSSITAIFNGKCLLYKKIKDALIFSGKHRCYSRRINPFISPTDPWSPGSPVRHHYGIQFAVMHRELEYLEFSRNKHIGTYNDAVYNTSPSLKAFSCTVINRRVKIKSVLSEWLKVMSQLWVISGEKVKGCQNWKHKSRYLKQRRTAIILKKQACDLNVDRHYHETWSHTVS